LSINHEKERMLKKEKRVNAMHSTQRAFSRKRGCIPADSFVGIWKLKQQSLQRKVSMNEQIKYNDK